MDVKKSKHCPSCTCNSVLSTQTTLYEDVFHDSLDWIDAEISRFAALVHHLPSKRNDFQPVRRLPPEILTVIFKLVREMEIEQGNHLDAYTIDRGTIHDHADAVLYHQHRQSGWLYVCSAWYNLGTSTPTLWTTLSLDQPMALNMLSIKHSQGLPLDVHIRCTENSHPNFVSVWGAILKNNAFRFRTIDIYADEETISELFSRYIDSKLPNLRTLQIEGAHVDGDMHTAAGSIIAHGLERLVLKSHCFFSHLPLTQTAAGLRSLKLFVGLQSTLTCEELRSALSGFRALEYLSVHCTDYHSKWPEVPGVPPLQLPNLAELRITHSAASCLALLRLFELLDSCYISLACGIFTPNLPVCLDIGQIFMSSTTSTLTIQIDPEDFLVMNVETTNRHWQLLLLTSEPLAHYITIGYLGPLFRNLAVTRLSLCGSDTTTRRLDAPRILTLLGPVVWDEALFPNLVGLWLKRMSFAGNSVGEVAAASRALWAVKCKSSEARRESLNEVVVADCSEIGSEAYEPLKLESLGIKLIWDGKGMDANQEQ